jgi:hypothetical protein
MLRVEGLAKGFDASIVVDDVSVHIGVRSAGAERRQIMCFGIVAQGLPLVPSDRLFF